MGYNSTIRSKKKTCTRCGKLDYWFSRKRCKQCATIEDSLARMEEDANEEIQKEGLSDLIKVADAIYSKWVRLSAADQDGNNVCYTCGSKQPWVESQCGHYVKRGSLYLRFDPRNTRVQCRNCNEFLDGNYAEYRKRLEEERPGITDILQEEAAIIYHPYRHEIQQIVNEYSIKVKQLLK